MNLDEARQRAATQPGWLQQMPEKFRSEVLARCTLHRYDAGEALHAEGDAASSMYGIIEGQVKVALSASDGQSYLAHILMAGTWGGEGPALTGSGRPVSLMAAQPTVTLRLSHAAMMEIVSNDPTYWPLFVERLMGHLTTSVSALADSMIRDHRTRVAAVLLRLANLPAYAPQTAARQDRFEIEISQEELARIANLGRTTISSILSGLRAEEILDPAYGRIVILDANGLRKILRAE